jgi:hypothetical protein
MMLFNLIRMDGDAVTVGDLLLVENCAAFNGRAAAPSG